MLELWLATHNPKKAEELRRCLPPAVEIHTLAELPDAASLDVVEDAPDFAGNAGKKARETAGFLRRGGIADDALVLADDSGLCVDALGGRPGVRSSRYAGEGASDADRIRKLLGELRGVAEPRRTARFVCSLAVVRVDGLPVFATEQICEGKIQTEPAGEGGFGYDPVFVPVEPPPGGQGLSFAQLSAEQKDAVSHRGKALRELALRVRALLGPETP